MYSVDDIPDVDLWSVEVCDLSCRDRIPLPVGSYVTYTATATHGETLGNPVRVLGVVTRNDFSDPQLPNYVLWKNGTRNSYAGGELTVVDDLVEGAGIPYRSLPV